MVVIKVCRKKLKHIISALKKAEISYKIKGDFLEIFVSNIEEADLPENIKEIIILNEKEEKWFVMI